MFGIKRFESCAHEIRPHQPIIPGFRFRNQRPANSPSTLALLRPSLQFDPGNITVKHYPPRVIFFWEPLPSELHLS